MKLPITSFLLFFTISLLAQQAPVAPVRPVVEEYCGEQVTDRYRYMENMDDPEVQRWFNGQADYTNSVLANIPGRDSLESQLMEVMSRESSDVYQIKIARNDRYFYLKTNQSENIARLYFRDGYEGEEQLLFDPTTFNPASEKEYVLFFFQPSGDGNKVAMSITTDGAEVGTLMIIDVKTRTWYPERIEGFWFGELSWLPDSERFFYLLPERSNPDTSALFNKTLLHQVGTSPLEDREILSKTNNPNLGIKDIDFPLVYVSYPNPSHLIAELGGVSADRKIFYAPIEQLNQDSILWQQLTDVDDGVGKSVVAIKDDEFVILTSKNTERFKIIKTPVLNPDLEHAEVVVPESDEVIKEFVFTSEGLFYSTVADGVRANLYYLPSKADTSQKINLPVQAGRIDIQSAGKQSSNLRVGLEGWTIPYSRYEYLTATNEFKEQPLSSKTKYPEFENLIVEEVTVSSHDGALVPLSVIYRKGTARDSSAPTMLRGYGSYGFSIEPSFSPMLLSWITKGGIYAIAHVRGGGELGDAWHQGGKKATKPNTWKDFIACAEYLIENNYTTSEKLSIMGRSAGGILIGRAMTERPDLFAVSIALVGSMNALRFENTPSGPNNTKEFGTVKNPEECKGLLEMDAYLHIEDNTDYPATLVTTGMKDPRVTPWIPAKFTARLQAATTSENPVLLRVDYADGHGFASTKLKQAARWADIFSFALWQTGHPDFQSNASTQTNKASAEKENR